MSGEILSAGVGFLSAAAGVLVYKWRAKVDVEAKKEAAAVDAQAVPLQLLRDELNKREGELNELRLADRHERDEYLKTLTSISGAMNQVAADLKSLRQEECEGRAKVHNRLDIVDTRLTVIETRLEK